MIRSRPLKQIEADELGEARFEYYTKLQTTADASDVELQSRIDALFQDTVAFRNRLNDEEIDDRIFSMAIAWGDSVIKRLEWTWCFIESDDEETMAVASPDLSLAVPVFVMLKRTLQEEKGKDSPLLIFSYLMGGRYSGAPGSLRIIG